MDYTDRTGGATSLSENTKYRMGQGAAGGDDDD